MLNLYWKSGDKTRTLVDKPFDSEADFEQYLFQNQEILGGDIFIIFRQIRTGNKQEEPYRCQTYTFDKSRVFGPDWGELIPPGLEV